MNSNDVAKLSIALQRKDFKSVEEFNEYLYNISPANERLSLPTVLVDTKAQRTWKRFVEQYDTYFYIDYAGLTFMLSELKLAKYQSASEYSPLLDYIDTRTKEGMRQATKICKAGGKLIYAVVYPDKKDFKDMRKIHSWGLWDGSQESSKSVERFIEWKKKRNKGRCEILESYIGIAQAIGCLTNEKAKALLN